MAFRLTVWLLALTFVATIYNVVSAYGALGEMNVQSRFQEIGLLHDGRVYAHPLPPRKPLQVSELASTESFVH